MKFLTQWVSMQTSHPDANAYISKTVHDRAILTKFLTHRVSLQSSHPNFQKKIVLPKMARVIERFR